MARAGPGGGPASLRAVRGSRQQTLDLDRPRAFRVADRVADAASGLAGPAPLVVLERVHGHAGVLALRVQGVEVDVEVGMAGGVPEALLDGVRLDAPEGLHAGVLGMHALAHALDDEERGEVVEVRFPAARRAGRADLPVHPEARAEDRRVADAARDLEKEARRRRDPADLAFRVDAVAIDRAVHLGARKEA